jgi:hypothetical protein
VLVLLSFGSACPIQLAVGIPCPTCGITRATRLALHGDFAGATHMHPLVWIAVPVVVLFVTVELVGYARNRTWGSSRRMRGGDALMLGTASMLFALWLARFAGFFGGPVNLSWRVSGAPARIGRWRLTPGRSNPG